MPALALLLALWSSGAARAQDEFCYHPGNLTVNCDMNSFTDYSSGGNVRVIADGWSVIVEAGSAAIDQGADSVVPPSQWIWSDGSHFTVTMLQRVAVAPGGAYMGGVAWAPFTPDTSNMNRQVGLDPTGGTNPNAASVQWGPQNWGYCRICDFRHSATATGGAMTIFVRVENPQSNGVEQLFIDGIWMRQTGSAPPPPPPTAPPPPPPPPTATSAPPTATTAPPTVAPSASPTAAPSASPTRAATAPATQTVAATATRATTATAASTRALTATSTREATATTAAARAAAPATSSATVEPSATTRPSATARNSATPRATVTPRASATARRTATAAPSATARPSETPEPIALLVAQPSPEAPVEEVPVAAATDEWRAPRTTQLLASLAALGMGGLLLLIRRRR